LTTPDIRIFFLNELDSTEVITALPVLWGFQPFDQQCLHCDYQYITLINWLPIFIRIFIGKIPIIAYRVDAEPGESVPTAFQTIVGMIFKA